MIEDPILLEGPGPSYVGASLLSISSGNRMVRTVVSPSGDDLSLYYFDDRGIALFYIIKRFGNCSRFYKNDSGGIMPADLFFSDIRVECPDFAEWLLFHPEWL